MELIARKRLAVRSVAEAFFLQPGEHFLHFGFRCALIEFAEHGESLGLQFDEHAGKELLVRHGVAFQTVGHNVVDIFDKHHVGIDVVEIFNKRAVAARAEEQAAVLLAERRIVGVGGRRVGRGFLFRETNVESGIVGGGILRGFLCCQCLEEGAVLGRHGEVYVHFSVLALSVERAFHEVFFQRRARALGVAVEFQQSFRQCAVVETVLA